MANSKILIVDDDPYNVLLVTEMMSHEGFEFISARDGYEALDVAEKELPNLIILDWNMPRLDGLETLKALKQNPTLKDIPVIMLTGIMASSENLMTAMSEGAIDFVSKPFNKVELLSRIKSMLLLSHSMLELKEKYEIIENSNKFIHSVFEKIPHPLVYYSPDGKIILHNQEFRRLVTTDENQLIGKSIYTYLNAHDDDVHKSYDLEIIKNRGKVNYEHSAGIEKNVFIFTKNIFYNLHDENEGIICLMTNITELKNAHELIIENKKKELASSTLKLIQTTESKNILIDQLNKVNAFANKKGKDLIRNIIKQVGNFSGESVWKEFETRFENVYESFYKELNQRYPDLTPGEKKLCALLRLSLSTKDIASITFQNPQSIDVARYRLRKKLKLAPDDNLVDFLLKID
jgi:PAS domain S-box-containing protein